MKRALAALVFANLAVYTYLHLVAVPPPSVTLAPSPHPLRIAGELNAAPGPHLCRSVGPLGDGAVAGLAAAWLTDAKRTVSVRSLEASAAPAYWVVTTRKNVALATRLVQQLRAAAVADVELLPPEVPDGETRVSLGVYADRARAERRIVDLKGYALGPSILEQSRRVLQWWIDVEPAVDGVSIDLAALVRAVPGAAGASLSPCVVALPPADAPAETTPPAPQPAPKAARGAT